MPGLRRSFFFGQFKHGSGLEILRRPKAAHGEQLVEEEA